MFHGAVPYRDLFDHKGPLLYFLYGIGYLMDSTGFLGIFFLQVISMFLVLLFAYKIAKLYLDTCVSAVFVAILLPVFSFSAKIYADGGEFGGGGPEEFMLPIFTICLYMLIQLVKFPPTTLTPIRNKMFLFGLLTGFIFLLKFTFVVFSVGLLLPWLIDTFFKNKKTFFISLLFLFIGFMAALLQPKSYYYLGCWLQYFFKKSHLQW